MTTTTGRWLSVGSAVFTIAATMRGMTSHERGERQTECGSTRLASHIERAGIAEFNAACSLADDRLGCGQPEQVKGQGPTPLFGTETAGHVWLHHQCWSALNSRRKAVGAEPAAMKHRKGAFTRGWKKALQGKRANDRCCR